MDVKPGTPPGTTLGAPSSSSALGEAKQKAQSGYRPTAELELGAPSNGAPSDDVPSGYKRTEVGVIPEDWEALPLGDIITLQRGFDLPHRLREQGSVPIVTSSGVEATHSKAKVEGPGVVTGRYGTIGEVYFVTDDFWPLNTTLYVKRFFGSDPLFISYLLRTLYFHDYSGKSGVPGVNRNDLHTALMPIPPTKTEQRAIATALSDADALIAALQRLIAKKRAIKQGTMQALLAGRQRLPGFTGEWETKLLSQLADIRSGGTPATNQSAFWDGDVAWCTPTDITALRGYKYLRSTARKISRLGLNASSAELLPAHSIVMTSRATIGECAINLAPVTTNQGFKNLVPHDDVNVEYLYYLLLTQTSGFISLCGGSTFLEIGKRQLAGYEVTLPATTEEQTAIATVLADMDAEIEALEARLAKTRALKAGMMQQLLTGRIRLV